LPTVQLSVTDPPPLRAPPPCWTTISRSSLSDPNPAEQFPSCHWFGQKSPCSFFSPPFGKVVLAPSFLKTFLVELSRGPIFSPFEMEFPPELSLFATDFVLSPQARKFVVPRTPSFSKLFKRLFHPLPFAFLSMPDFLVHYIKASCLWDTFHPTWP